VNRRIEGVSGNLGEEKRTTRSPATMLPTATDCSPVVVVSGGCSGGWRGMEEGGILELKKGEMYKNPKLR